MREILFRGKRMDTGEWVTGAYYLQKQCYGDDNEKHFIITSSEALGYDQALECAEVDSGTVGQFTGLHANGKRIFEGDVCRFTRINALGWTNSRVGQVLFPYDEETPCFYMLATTGDAWSFVALSDIEVIGTIYDNPELLEVTHDE